MVPIFGDELDGQSLAVGALPGVALRAVGDEHRVCGRAHAAGEAARLDRGGVGDEAHVCEFRGAKGERAPARLDAERDAFVVAGDLREATASLFALEAQALVLRPAPRGPVARLRGRRLGGFEPLPL